MTTKVDETAPSIDRLSTLVPEIGSTAYTFTRFLLDHTGFFVPSRTLRTRPRVAHLEHVDRRGTRP